MLAWFVAAALASPPCQHTLTLRGNAGEIRVTEKTYTNDLQQCWRIVADPPAGRRVRLAFGTVDVETGYDHVEIYASDGRLLTADALTDTSAYDPRGFLVRFETDASVTQTGFTARWSVEPVGEPERTEPVGFRVPEVLLPAGVVATADLTEVDVEVLTACNADFGERFETLPDAVETLGWLREVCARKR